MDGGPPAQLVFKIDLNRVAHIGPDDQRLHLVIGLRRGQRKAFPRLPLDACRVLLQYIQQAVRIVVTEFVVYNGEANRLDIINPELF